MPVAPVYFETAFALCNGPLLAAVLAWRNSFVFHSLDHADSPRRNLSFEVRARSVPRGAGAVPKIPSATFEVDPVPPVGNVRSRRAGDVDRAPLPAAALDVRDALG